MTVRFVDRKVVFKQNPKLARHLHDFQEACYGPTDNLVKAGEEIWLNIEDDKPTRLTKEQAEQFNAEEMNYLTSMKDSFTPKLEKLNHCDSFIANLPAESFEDFTASIGGKLKTLSNKLNWSELLIISSVPKPYIGQDNPFESAQMALQSLKNIGLGENFAGGIIVEPSSMDSFFASIFWIVRCNASAPYILFSAKDAGIIGTLCKYGNIHFDCYDETENVYLKDALLETGMIKTKACEELYSATGIIDGRELKLD